MNILIQRNITSESNAFTLVSHSTAAAIIIYYIIITRNNIIILHDMYIIIVPTTYEHSCVIRAVAIIIYAVTAGIPAVAMVILSLPRWSG